MRVAIGSDMAGDVPEAVDRWLRERDHQTERFGVIGEGDDAWPSIAEAVGLRVARGQAEYGVLCCWTGTGVSIAANKVSGVRAALCGDAITAAGARQWNDANVLCLSLRITTVALAHEMLEAWFAATATTDPPHRAMIERVRLR